MVVADFYLRAHVNKRPAHSIPLWSRANWDAMRQSSIQFAIDFGKEILSRSIEQIWKCFERHLKDLLNQHVPRKSVCVRRHLPWMNTRLHRMCKRKGRLYVKAKKDRAYSRRLLSQS